MSLRSLLDRFKAVIHSKLFRARAKKSTSMARTYEFFANRGPAFEPPLVTHDVNSPASQALMVAFYLPQFHRFSENDAWWGNGFTEWHNVARGLPRYENHYQPRIPADLGFYDLSDIDVLKSQAVLAKENGLSAFCFYYYWFNGHRLLEKPLDLFAESDMPIDFCLMWANENWTRTWDGLNNEILIQQDYREEDELEFISDTARYMANTNYLTIADRPVFIIYRASLLPEPRKTLARWRSLWTKQLGIEPWLLMAQSFDEVDPRPYGLDGAVEFPPHKICKGLGNLRKRVNLLDENFTGLIRDYEAVVNNSLQQPVPEFPEIKTISPSWDNDARRQSGSTSFYGATPKNYERWANGAIEHAKAHPFAGVPIVFVNAWNEWAEGAYLEPDVHYGHAMLNATKRAVFGMNSDSNTAPLLLLGHDAHRHGSQMLLLHLVKAFKEEFKINVDIVLQQGGALVRDYQRYARTTILNNESLAEHLHALGRPLTDYRAAIANTTVSGNLMPELKQASLHSLCLIHELPTIIRDYNLQSQVKNIAEYADYVVFPAEIVKEGFESFGTSIQGISCVQPQGSYLSVEFNESIRKRFRDALGLKDENPLIINVGFADTRKGFDLFIKIAEESLIQHPTWHFAWVGKMHSDMQLLANKAFENDAVKQRLHLPGFISGNTDHFSAADAFLLTSREDPYPTVILEALEAGLPIMVFDNCTGLTELARQYGAVLPSFDVKSTVHEIEQLLQQESEAKKQARTHYIHNQCQFNPYCEGLLAHLGIKHQ